MIVGASFDSQDDNKKFADKFSFNFPLICDTTRTIGTSYGANPDPAKGAQRVGVVISPDGKIKEWHERVGVAGGADQRVLVADEGQHGRSRVNGGENGHAVSVVTLAPALDDVGVGRLVVHSAECTLPAAPLATRDLRP